MSDLLILCYHAIGRDWPASFSVRPEALDHQLSRLVHRGYRGATFTEALKGPRHRRTVVVTFDDGFRSVLEQAKPVLDRFELVGTLYVPTDWPGRPDPMTWDGIGQWQGTAHETELRSLDWDQLRALAADGWEIGSHTCSHPHLPLVTDGDRLEDELVRSKAVVERELGEPCESLAYPYGEVDARVEAAVARAGYSAACTLPRARKLMVAGDPLLWPRTPIHRLDAHWRSRIKMSAGVRRLRASPVLATLAHRGHHPT